MSLADDDDAINTRPLEDALKAKADMFDEFVTLHGSDNTIPEKTNEFSKLVTRYKIKELTE